MLQDMARLAKEVMRLRLSLTEMLLLFACLLFAFCTLSIGYRVQREMSSPTKRALARLFSQQSDTRAPNIAEVWTSLA